MGKRSLDAATLSLKQFMQRKDVLGLYRDLFRTIRGETWNQIREDLTVRVMLMFSIYEYYFTLYTLKNIENV